MADRFQLLVPTDFSEASSVGVRAGAELARRFGAPIILVHVYDSSPLDPVVPFPDQGSVDRDLSRHAEQKLAEVRDALPEGVEATTIALNAPNPALAIADYADEVDATAIVVATHGRTGLSHFFLGSVAERIVRHARCPVLTIPARATPRSEGALRTGSRRGPRGRG